MTYLICQFYMCLLLRMFKDIGREPPVFNMFLDVEISVENLFIPCTHIQLHLIELGMFIDHRPEVSSQSVNTMQLHGLVKTSHLGYFLARVICMTGFVACLKLHSLHGMDCIHRHEGNAFNGDKAILQHAYI